MSLKTVARDTVNKSLRPFGVQVVKGRSTDPAVQTFIPARKTIAAARREGLSVGDYLDRHFAEPGSTAYTVDVVIELSQLSCAQRVVEIGPGSGRYSERVISALQPASYEMYETAVDWLPHLAQLRNAVVMPCDGHSLDATATASADLVHAHKVFVYLPFGAVIGYLREMARVARPGGAIAFDVVTEACLDDSVVDSWVQHGTFFRPIPRDWIVEFMERLDVDLLGSRVLPMAESRTELLIFRRRGDRHRAETGEKVGP